MKQSNDQTARAGRGKRRMRLNLTSMIDVVFLLLIYFVVTANFAVGEGVIVAKMPTGELGGARTFPTVRNELTVKLHSAGRHGNNYHIEVDGAGPVTDFRRLSNVLAVMQFNEHNPQGIFKDDDDVVITPDGDVRWEHVVQGFNAALAARYKSVRFE